VVEVGDTNFIYMDIHV